MISLENEAKKLAEILSELDDGEKHGGYYALPDHIRSYFNLEDRFCSYRFCELERWRFIASQVAIDGKTVIDIGCNTGFFSCKAIEAGSIDVVGYEGKRSCSRFLNYLQSSGLNEGGLQFKTRYFDFASEFADSFHVCFLLNVLHHLGDDFGDRAYDISQARVEMLSCLNKMADKTKTLVLQVGYNWKGHIDKPLFENGEKQEVIEFIETGTLGHWKIKAIGVPTLINDQIIYAPPSKLNIERNDSLGEFLNRPIFVLDSMH